MAQLIDFHKYHAYGNAYTVLKEQQIGRELTAVEIQQLSHDAYGVGGDGLLIFKGHSQNSYHVRIFNPDGSEAEKSGNGLSILGAYLQEHHLIGNLPITLSTPHSHGSITAVAQTAPHQFQLSLIVGKAHIDVDPLTLQIAGRTFIGYRANLGNPHCVIFASVSKEEACAYGRLIENHAAFPNRTNVQFVQVDNRNKASIQIWERGAGYTAASGSSASAVTAVCYALGKTTHNIQVHMVGGILPVQIDTHSHHVTIHNTVHKIASGTICFPLQ